jgi:hypothetical protein
MCRRHQRRRSWRMHPLQKPLHQHRRLPDRWPRRSPQLQSPRRALHRRGSLHRKREPSLPAAASPRVCLEWRVTRKGRPGSTCSATRCFPPDARSEVSGRPLAAFLASRRACGAVLGSTQSSIRMLRLCSLCYSQVCVVHGWKVGAKALRLYKKGHTFLPGTQNING